MHEHLTVQLDEKICQNCNKPITVIHLLSTWNLYTTARQRFNIAPDLKDILQVNRDVTTILLQYLQETNLLDKI